MSIYDNIQTAADLVRHVKAHGLSTVQEDIVRAQDIFGHTPLEDLHDLANDIGRNDANGNPDPKGSWSSGRAETRSTFYSILFKIWNWEDATRFWHQHSDPDFEELVKLRADAKDLTEKVAHQREQIHLEHDNRLKETNLRLDAEKEVRRLAAELHARDMEIMELKAKLYDLMIKTA